MKTNKLFGLVGAILLCGVVSNNNAMANGCNLRTDLMLLSDKVWQNGYRQSISLDEAIKNAQAYQFAEVRSAKPLFTWELDITSRELSLSQANRIQRRENHGSTHVLYSDKNSKQSHSTKIHAKHDSLTYAAAENTDTKKSPLVKTTLQTGYRIWVASSPDLLKDKKPDMWDSGRVRSAQQSAIYDGEELQAGTIYYWQVQTQENGKTMEWSEPKAFITAFELEKDYAPSYYPLEKTDEVPSRSFFYKNEVENPYHFYDFGAAAYGTVRLKIQTQNDLPAGKVLNIRLGEDIEHTVGTDVTKRVNRKPGGTIRYAEYKIQLQPGKKTYRIEIKPDNRNTSGAAIRMPSYIGQVMPFRYCEIEADTKDIDYTIETIARESVHYPFDETKSAFKTRHSKRDLAENKGISDSMDVLNDVWNICKYTMKGSSFCGYYVDGDRERIPYEADAIINQLSHYSVDSEYTMARRSLEYLIYHPTWPTEWHLQIVLIAWNDYLYTGDKRSLETCYDELKAKTLLALADDETCLISTRTGKQSKEFLDSIHFTGKQITDIVDWPQGGGFGQDGKPGESDGFVFKEYNTVVNAYHYRDIVLMQKIADLLGKKEDADFFAERAAKVYESFNQHFYYPEKGTYRDGIGTDHCALHSAMFAMAFNLVPNEHKASVMDFIRSRKMACSVYGSQFLMDAIYDANDADYGYERLTATDDRSWYNMIILGSTMTLEAWDNKYKNNLDWNHPWGAAPANIIARKLVGVEPLEAGFSKVRVKIQPSVLKDFSASIPTIRGNINVSSNVQNDRTATYQSYIVSIPNGVQADVWIPVEKENATLLGNKNFNCEKIGKHFVFHEIQPGTFHVYFPIEK